MLESQRGGWGPGPTRPSVFTGWDHRAASASDEWHLPPPLQKHLFQFVSLFILQMPDCSRNFSHCSLQNGVAPRSLPCRQLEIKAGSCRRGETSMTSSIHATSRLPASRSLVTSHNKESCPRVIIHQNEAFMAHQKTMNRRSERSVCNVK